MVAEDFVYGVYDLPRWLIESKASRVVLKVYFILRIGVCILLLRSVVSCLPGKQIFENKRGVLCL